MKKNILLSAALMFFGLTASAQTKITFDKNDYKSIGVYEQWEESPFRTGVLTGNAAVADNPDTKVDEVLGHAPNSTSKVLALQRSRHGGNTFGVRIDLKEPIRVTKEYQYIHVMTYLKDKPADSRMMVIGLGKRVEDSWSWQTGEEEQFWAWTVNDIKPKEGWQDIVVKFKGFSYSKAENANSGIDIYSLVIVPDVRSAHADKSDWVAYFDEIVVDDTPDKRFSTDKYALVCTEDSKTTRDDRAINGVGLTVNGKSYSATPAAGMVYSNNTTSSVFSATAGAQVQPTFNYKGTWMSAYVYVDWGNDGVFKATVNNDGSPAEDSDIVSYNAAQVNGSWRKSDGTAATGDGNTISQGVPKFTVPANTAKGFYRMRYKVDWNSIEPAGSETMIRDGGGLVDLTLDVHGDKVNVNASQLNGDIVLASDKSPLQNYTTAYGQPLTVKVVPAPGFVQNGFTLKYGYNVNAKEQLDDNNNPNWIEVKVPFSAIAADGTYTIPGEYMRGANVSISGDMQQVRKYTLEVTGADGGVVYAGAEYKNGATIEATQYFSADDVTPIKVEGYTSKVTFDSKNNVLKVVYSEIFAYIQVTTLSELDNEKFYHIKAESGEGYWAWNTTITDTYISLRGLTNSSYNNLPSNQAIANIYKEAIDPFDKTVVWQILLEDGKYYIYQPASQAYVTRLNDRDYGFTFEKTALDGIRDNGDGTFSIHAGGGYSDGSQKFACIVTNESSYAVRNWTWDDHGSVLEIWENPNINLNEETAVENVVVTTAVKGIYNLQGQKLETLPESGIVIVNGEKYLIKNK